MRDFKEGVDKRAERGGTVEVPGARLEGVARWKHSQEVQTVWTPLSIPLGQDSLGHGAVPSMYLWRVVERKPVYLWRMAFVVGGIDCWGRSDPCQCCWRTLRKAFRGWASCWRESGEGRRGLLRGMRGSTVTNVRIKVGREETDGSADGSDLTDQSLSHPTAVQKEAGEVDSSPDESAIDALFRPVLQSLLAGEYATLLLSRRDAFLLSPTGAPPRT